MRNMILSSFGSFIGRPNGRNYKLVKEIVDKINCDGIEFLVLTPWQENIINIAHELKDITKPVPVFHLQKEVGELISRNQNNDIEKAVELFKISCEAAKIMNSKQLVLHLWGGISSDKNINSNFEKLNTLLDISKKNELLLSIENVCCNKYSPRKHIKHLSIINSEIFFTFDTKFAQFHNELNESLEGDLKSLWINKRINHIHINDYDGKYKEWEKLRGRQIGEGNVDFIGFFNHLNEIKYTGTITVEAPAFYEDKLKIDKINESIRFIRESIRDDN